MAQNGAASSPTKASSATSAASSSSSSLSSPPSAEQVLNVNVGILGHVDSGKTSLVKTLSTLLSTAALDKSKQSRQRGMTLDLGFSCFFLELPEHLKKLHPTKSQLQMTLVDCPGHASLIRTIIGGAQIIDMVLLVVDAYKGWQAQTTECLVLAELTSPHLVVALNKVDMFPEAEREEKIEQAKAKVRERLKNSRFPNAPMVGVSACIGGEKVAATTSSGNSSTTLDNQNQNKNNPTYNIDLLIDTLHQSLPTPRRNPEGSPFYFAIDHCFPIKGMGTVLTGTCLSGKIKTNDMIEFPTLGLERKIKSMQMFKRKTPHIQQGDRAGICVSSLDSNLLERGVCASPGAVQLLKGAITLVRKISYFPGSLPNKHKFHISVGHTTVMATVSFWGARELLEKQQQQLEQPQPPEQQEQQQQQQQKQQQQQQQQQQQSTKKTGENKKGGANNKKELLAIDGSNLGGDADRAGLPFLKFDWDQDFLQQDGVLDVIPDQNSTTSTTAAAAATSSTNTTATTTTTTTTPPLLHWAMIDFQTPVFCPLNSLIIGSRLDSVDNNNHTSAGPSASSCRLAFCGRLLEPLDPIKDASRIRLYTPKQKEGTISRLGDPHKRQDDGKVVRYEVFGSDLFKKETILKPFIGMKLVTPNGDIGELKSAFGTSGKFRVYFPAGTDAREGDTLILPFKRFANDPEKKMRQDIVLPAARPGTRMEPPQKNNKGKNNNNNNKKANKKPEAVGQIEKLKGDLLENGKYNMAIVAGLFTPEVNVREAGAGKRVVVPSTNEEGQIAGAFGKAGKCKVSFEEGISAEVGAKVELYSSNQ